jgi:hypothetical protein
MSEVLQSMYGSELEGVWQIQFECLQAGYLGLAH